MSTPTPVTAVKPPRQLTGYFIEEWAVQDRETVLIAGAPKGAGKTTLAMSMGKPDDYIAVVANDLGKLSRGLMQREKGHTFVIPYQELTREFTAAGGHSKPKRDIFLKITGDLFLLYNSIKEQKAIPLADGREFPPPTHLVLDGMSRLNTMLVDGQCSLNNIDDPSDLDNKAFKFWGKRLRDALTLVEQFACLPCTVAMTAWLDQVKNADGSATGVWYPDVGGKMDMLAAGTVGAAILAYSRQGEFFVRTKADGQYPWIGVRDRYNLQSEINVTVKGATGEVPPWQRIFK